MNRLVVLTLLSCICLSACKDQSIRDLDVAVGKVAGEDWSFAKGNGIYGLSEYTITLMSDKVTASNICGVLAPASPYVKFTIPARAGIYQMSDLIADKQVKFHEGSFSSTSLTAASGYIQIISITSFTIDGIVEASLDEENDISGAFYVETCN